MKTGLANYSVPFPPKFNVPFYIVLCTIYPTLCGCHLSLHSRFNFFAFNIQLSFMSHSSFRFRHSIFSLSNSQVFEFDFQVQWNVHSFIHPTFSIRPLSFCFPDPTLDIALASFSIRLSTFRIELLPSGQRPMEIMGSIDLTQPRSNGGRESLERLPSGVDSGNLLHSRQSRRRQTCSRPCDKAADRQDAAAPSS